VVAAHNAAAQAAKVAHDYAAKDGNRDAEKWYRSQANEHMKWAGKAATRSHKASRP